MTRDPFARTLEAIHNCALEADEKRYLENRCNVCELDWTERRAAWKAGGADPALDSLFDAGEIRAIH